MQRERMTRHGPLAMAVAIVLLCLIGPSVLPLPPPVGGDVVEAALPLGAHGHALGTDANGNDVLSRLLHGGRASLALAFAVNVAGGIAGGLLGALCGFRGGRLDACVMRALDVPIAFPSLIAVIAVAQAFGHGIGPVAVTLTVFAAPGFARVARSAARPLATQPFVHAARLCGRSERAILVRHVWPAVTPTVVSYACLGVGTVVALEGALGLLGLGVPPPHPSWGNMIADGRESLLELRTPIFAPALLLAMTVWAFSALADALRAPAAR